MRIRALALLPLSSLILINAAPPPQPQKLKERATPRVAPDQWITDQDYPTAAMADEVEGRTGFLLNVDIEGRVADCTVTLSSGSPVLDETTCAILKQRAVFTPARDKKGRPAPDIWQSKVVWQMPAGEPLQIENFPMRSTYSIDVDATGLIEGCRIVTEPPTPQSEANNANWCERAKRSKKRNIVLDEAGDSTRATIVTITEIKIIKR